ASTAAGQLQVPAVVEAASPSPKSDASRQQAQVVGVVVGGHLLQLDGRCHPDHPGQLVERGQPRVRVDLVLALDLVVMLNAHSSPLRAVTGDVPDAHARMYPLR